MSPINSTFEQIIQPLRPGGVEQRARELSAPQPSSRAEAKGRGWRGPGGTRDSPAAQSPPERSPSPSPPERLRARAGARARASELGGRGPAQAVDRSSGRAGAPAVRASFWRILHKCRKYFL
ncbi:Centromere Protein F [Manis pentadactyla]|nr:Centromere Protein F [Manis pentadactyla]